MKSYFYIRKRDGYLLCRFTDKLGKTKVVSTQLKPKKWNQKLQHDGDPEVNTTLKKWKEKTESCSSLDSLDDLLKSKFTTMSFFELVDLYNLTKDIRYSTQKKLESLKRVIPNDIDIGSIDKMYLYQLYKTFRKTMNEQSSYFRMSQIKAILNLAVDNDFISKNPMNGFKKKKPTKEIIYLTQEEIERIKYKELIGRLAKVRDVFIFQCYTAMEYSRLNTFEVKKHIDGQLWIFSTRQKTDKVANLPMLPEAKQIWDRYNQKLPIVSNQKMNGYLKEIQTICEIDKKLHTHLARHTFATTVCLRRGISAESTSMMMGISLQRLFASYGKIVDSRVSKEMSVFFDSQNPKSIKTVI